MQHCAMVAAGTLYVHGERRCAAESSAVVHMALSVCLSWQQALITGMLLLLLLPLPLLPPPLLVPPQC